MRELIRKRHDCLCGWNGRGDKLQRHLQNCKARFKIEALQNEISLWREKELSKTIPDIIIDKGNTVEESKKQEKQQLNQQIQNDKQGFLYILRTRESVRLDEPVYKIGKTYDIEQRFKQYPKGSELLKSIKVCERHVAEKVLLREFSSKFTNREEFGNEYFEGDLQEMLVIFKEFSRIFV